MADTTARSGLDRAITLDDLVGAWRLTRAITDHAAGIAGALDGTCIWRPDPCAAGGACLRQEEEGVLRYGSAPPMRAVRNYLWRQTPAGLAVFFADGRPFHELAPGHTTDRHLCGSDTYDVSYDFGTWPDWRQTWRVTGPRKDALIVSRFQRLG